MQPIRRRRSTGSLGKFIDEFFDQHQTGGAAASSAGSKEIPRWSKKRAKIPGAVFGASNHDQHPNRPCGPTHPGVSSGLPASLAAARLFLGVDDTGQNGKMPESGATFAGAGASGAAAGHEKPSRRGRFGIGEVQNPFPEEQAVLSAYRRRALQLHPDKNRGDERAVETFQLLQDARDLLLGKLQPEDAPEGLAQRTRMRRPSSSASNFSHFGPDEFGAAAGGAGPGLGSRPGTTPVNFGAGQPRGSQNPWWHQHHYGAAAGRPPSRSHSQRRAPPVDAIGPMPLSPTDPLFQIEQRWQASFGKRGRGASLSSTVFSFAEDPEAVEDAYSRRKEEAERHRRIVLEESQNGPGGFGGLGVRGASSRRIPRASSAPGGSRAHQRRTTL